jgi:hypothetical protein
VVFDESEIPATVILDVFFTLQDFFARNPGQGYGLAVALARVNKVRQSFAEVPVPLLDRDRRQRRRWCAWAPRAEQMLC